MNQYVIQKEGRNVGIMWVAQSQDDDMGGACYEVHSIYLHPDYHRQGIGAYAMEFACSVARDLSKTMMTVWVLEKNISSIKFYENCGFEADGKTKIINYGKPLTAIRMRRSL